MKQFNRLVEFRQAVYERGLSRGRDAQFELVDALLLSPAIRSFAELSLSPVFRRRWPSLYGAIKEGRQNVPWLEGHFARQVSGEGVRIFALDGSAWPHPAAKTLEDRQYVYSPTPAVDGGSVVVGHPYSILAWVPERGSSWALPVSVRRISSEQSAVEVGAQQVRCLCRQRRAEMNQELHLIVADGKYGNHRFLGLVKDAPYGVLVRLRRDRVLYAEPGLYQGRGRPRQHGQRFAFREPETWGTADATLEVEDARWGKVRLRRWDKLHARQDAETPFSVLLVEAHLEREKPAAPFWVGYLPPKGQEAGEQSVETLWYAYQQRWPVEPSIRFRKQYLYWTMPRFQKKEHADRWTMLVNVAQWQLFLARELVRDQPLPWQAAQQTLTPERVRQGLGGLFRQISPLTMPPKTRGKSPGWLKGRSRTRPKRHPVVKKTKAA